MMYVEEPYPLNKHHNIKCLDPQKMTYTAIYVLMYEYLQEECQEDKLEWAERRHGGQRNIFSSASEWKCCCNNGP